MSLFDIIDINAIENKCKSSNTPSFFVTKNTEEYDYIFLDLASLTLVAYLNNKKFTDYNSVNITPFIKTIELYLKLKKIPHKKIIMSIDNGIPRKMSKFYENYKQNRMKTKKRHIFKVGNTSTVYEYNVALIQEFFNALNCYIDTAVGEADFKIGYYLSELKNKKNLVLSADKDLILTSRYSDFLLRLYKKNKGFKYYYFNKENFKCFNEIEKISSSIDTPEKYLLFKALIGDKSDNISGILTNKKAINLIEKIENNLSIENIAEVAFNMKYIKDKKAFIQQLKFNLSIINIYNKEIFNSIEKRELEKNIKNFEKNNPINKNIVYEILNEFVHPDLKMKIYNLLFKK